MNYKTSLSKLYSISMFNSNKVGLNNMIKLNSLFGYPVKSIPIVHIAGTNGKGSVSVKLASCCSTSGLKTGLFISPHISSFRERIQIDGNLISESDTTNVLSKVFQMCETNQIPATFFEIVTASAFLHFQQSNCDVIVLECGLGGRLDSTNIVTPALSIITSIQFDHMNILGSTLEEIAMEKAGIMKPGVDVVVGPDCPINLLKSEAERVKSPFHHVQFPSRFTDSTSNQSRKQITYDAETINKEIARHSLQLLREMKTRIPIFEKLNSGLAENGLKAKLPCRFEHFACTLLSPNVEEIHNKKVNLILDMAHNEGGIQALVWKLQHCYPTRKFRFIVGMSQRPDILNCLLPLFKVVKIEQIHCIEANHLRAIPSTELKQHLLQCEQQTQQMKSMLDEESDSSKKTDERVNDEELVKVCQYKFQTNENQIKDNHLNQLHSVLMESLQLSLKNEELLVICGSAFIMSDVRHLLGITDSRDEI